MDNNLLKVSIPLDEENFIEMECDYCKNRFMLSQDVYENEENTFFFCPICGLPNKINTFFVPEVIELAQQKVLNYVCDELENSLGKSIDRINKNGKGFMKFSMTKSKRECERILYSPAESYVKCRKTCCDIDVKVKNIDKETGLYCPICGVFNNE